MRNGRDGFTILELLVFSALFTVSSIAFITILISVTRVQVRQSAAAEVNQQSQFLLQTIQRYVERSSVVEMAADAVTSTLKLRMPSSTIDPTYIYLLGGAAFLKETDAGAAQPLTSGKVSVSTLNFTRRANVGGHDSVSVSFTIAYRTSNLQQQFSQMLQTAVARVSAATFDSNVVPSAANTYKIGNAAADWQSVNNTLFFSTGNNVGVSDTSFTPGARLQVRNGDVYVDTSANGLMLKDTNGVCWRVRVSTGGSLTTASTTCP